MKAESTETSVDRVVAPKQLLALIADAHQKRDKISTIAGELGERIKNAVENGRLHRAAFTLMVRLYKMEELKREDFIRQIGLYVDMCREGNLFRPEHAGDLVAEADRLAGEAENEGAQEPLGRDDEPPLTEAAMAVQSGIKQLADNKPKRGRPRKALEGAEAAGATRIQ